MKVLVISDTHNRINRVDMLLEVLKAEGIQHIIHAGDHLSDAKEIQRKYPYLTVHMVPGNCDIEGYGSGISRVIQIEEVAIFVTHGHKHNVKYDYDEVWIDAMANEVQLAIFGHTHSAYKEKKQGIMLLNPGSLAEPRDTTMPSFGLVEIEKGIIKDVKVLQLLGKDHIGKHPFF